MICLLVIIEDMTGNEETATSPGSNNVASAIHTASSTNDSLSTDSNMLSCIDCLLCFFVILPRLSLMPSGSISVLKSRFYVYCHSWD